MPQCPSCNNVLTATERTRSSCPVCGVRFSETPLAVASNRVSAPVSADVDVDAGPAHQEAVVIREFLPEKRGIGREVFAVVIGQLVGAAVGVLIGAAIDSHAMIILGISGAIGAGLDRFGSVLFGHDDAMNGGALVTGAIGCLLGGVIGGAHDGLPFELMAGFFLGLLAALISLVVISLLSGTVGKVLEAINCAGCLLGFAGGAAAAFCGGFEFPVADNQFGPLAVLVCAGGIAGVVGGLVAQFVAKKLRTGAQARALVPLCALLTVSAVATTGLLIVSPLQVRIGHPGRAGAVAISPDGFLAVANRQKLGKMDENVETVRVIDLRTGQTRARLQQSDGVGHVSVTPDGKHAVGDGRIWNLSTGELQIAMKPVSVDTHTYKFDTNSSFYGKSELDPGISIVLPDGRHSLTVLVFRGTKKESFLAIWDLQSGNVLWKSVAHTGVITSLAISKDGRLALSAAEDGKLKFWKVNSDEGHPTLSEVRSIDVGEEHINVKIAAALSPDGKTAAAAVRAIGVEDVDIRLFEMETGKETGRISGHRGGVTSLAYAPDGRRLVSGSEDSTARIWDTTTGNEVVRIHVRQPVYRLCLDRTGKQLLVATQKGPLRLYKID